MEKFLLAGGADIALCSSCIDNFGNLKIIGTLYIYEELKVTFMVPKPHPVDSAKFLYISVSFYVWIFFAVSLGIVCILLNFFAIQ